MNTFGSKNWMSFTISIAVKRNFGKLGIKYKHCGEFRFCAQTRHDAIALDCSNVPGGGERLVHVTGCLPVVGYQIPAATPGDG
jgi:hypothetical protein